MKIRTIVVSLLIVALIAGATGLAAPRHGNDCDKEHEHLHDAIDCDKEHKHLPSLPFF